MNLLLDTHILLWAASGTLSKRIEALVNDETNILFFSPASIWEVGIKKKLGRSDFQVDPEVLRRGLLDNGYRELPISGLHALAACELPMLHKDPFDRMLLAQAKCEGFSFVTADRIIRDYPGPILFFAKS